MDEFDLVMKRSQHGPEANSTTLEKPHYNEDLSYTEEKERDKNRRSSRLSSDEDRRTMVRIFPLQARFPLKGEGIIPFSSGKLEDS